MIIDEKLFREWKAKHRGFYQDFNTKITKYYLSKMFDYNYLIETAKDYNSFEKFYNYHTNSKQNLIENTVEKMYDEAVNKGFKLEKEWAYECLVVRLGNCWYGNNIEDRILKTISFASPYITCKKTEPEIDKNYKVDGIVEIVGIDRLAIQIKPLTFTYYDKGSELEYHKMFENEFGPKVYYLFYKENGNIIFNNVEIKLVDKEKIIEQIEKLLVYK